MICIVVNPSVRQSQTPICTSFWSASKIRTRINTSKPCWNICFLILGTRSFPLCAAGFNYTPADRVLSPFLIRPIATPCFRRFLIPLCLLLACWMAAQARNFTKSGLGFFFCPLLCPPSNSIFGIVGVHLLFMEVRQSAQVTKHGRCMVSCGSGRSTQNIAL